MGASKRKCSPEELVKLCFDAKFDEEWTVVQKHDRTEGHELNVISWELSKAHWFVSSQPLRVLRMRVFLSLRQREGPVTRGS